MKNSISYLESELNKIFESLDTTSCIKVSFILSNLNLKTQEENYTKFPIEAIQKLYILKRIKGINHYHKLKLTESDLLNLGFFKDENNKLTLPPKRTFNNYLSNLPQEQIKFLDSIAEKILTIATKHNKILDIELVKDTITKKRKEIENKNKAFKEAVKIVKRLVYPKIDIKIKENGKFTTKDLLDVLVHIAQTKDFAHNGTATFKELNSEAKCPSSWTMLYHFNKFNSRKRIKEMFEKIFDVIFHFARKNYKELNRRKLDIALDVHKIPYYGDKNDSYVVEGKNDRGTSHFYQFLTCSIVVAGRRFVLDAIPIHKLDNLENLVDKIIKRTQSNINIDKAYLDRGFDKPKVINILKANKVKFIMPKIRTDIVKDWIRKSTNCKARIIKDFKIGKKDVAIVNLILVDDDEGIKRAFITNFHIPVQLAHYLYSWYSKRWGIETSYRNMDHDFKAKTTSKNYLIRLFYFLFTVCLYNLWILVNICVSLAIYGRLSEKPIITAKLFAVVLYRVAYEDPPT
ncbi:MAG: transposase [Candidatus Woesearchaeota archaeon]